MEIEFIPGRITVTVGRTIQERPYEPYTVSISMEFASPEDANISLVDEHIDKVRSYLEKKVDTYCSERRDAAIEQPRYY